MISSDFSRIAHLPGSHADVDDLVLNDDEAAAFLAQETLVFEKLDGLNVMITSAGAGRLQASLKSDWRGVGGGRVETAIAIWLAQRESTLARALPGASCLYGEWLWHTVSVPYTHLDDVFVAFSLRDHRGRLVSHDRMANQLEGSGVAVAQPLCRRRLRHPSAVSRLARRGRFTSGTPEGVILDVDGGDEQRRFAKWVNASYVHPHKGALSGEHNQRRQTRS